jgi:hypothetical protein
MTNDATREFIARHADADVRRLALRGTKEADVDLPFALQQIAGRQRARTKLPTWAATKGIVYPPQLNLEQCSSETTARYKAAVAKRLLARHADNNPPYPLPTTFADLTGGFGVDCSFMAPVFSETTYVEQQPSLCAIATENFSRLGLTVAVVCADSTAFLRKASHYTLLYIDPARRDNHGSRTYAIADCTPDVMTLRDELMAHADYVMIKLSPMLDWRKAVADMGVENVSEVHIVSVANECKELLMVMEKPSATQRERRMVCINDDTLFETLLPIGTASAIPVTNLPPLALEATSGRLFAYLYEPNASIMKAGCFTEVSARFGLKQIAPNSHLFVSNNHIADFPGRVFTVETVTTLNKRELKASLHSITQANITVRNFPLSVAALRQRLRLADGGSTYIFATTLANGVHVLIVCQKAI